MLLMWSVLTRWFDRRAAVLAVFLFALGPPTLTKYSLLAKGNHFENLPFQLLCLWTFLRLHSTERKRPWILAHGAAAGFAIFFYFGSMALIALLALTHVGIRGPRQALRDFVFAAPAFVVGLAPLLWVHFQSGSRPGGFLESKFGESSRPPMSEMLQRVQEFFTSILPRAGVYPDLGPLPGRIAEWLFLGVFAAAWILLAVKLIRDVVRSGKSSESARFLAFTAAPLVLYLPFVVLVVGAGNIKFDAYGPPVEIGTYRYLVPHFLFATMIIAIACGWLMRAESVLQRTLGKTLAAASLATCAFTLPLVDPAPTAAGVGTHYAGYSLRFYNNVLMRDAQLDPATGRLDWDWDRVQQQIEEFEPRERHELWFGAGYHRANALTLPARRALTPPSLRLEDLMRLIPVDARPDVALGAGSWLRQFVAGGPEGKAFLRAELLRLCADQDPLVGWVIEGLGRPFDYPLVRATGPALGRTGEARAFVPPGFEGGWLRGLGAHCGELLEREIAVDTARVSRVGEALPETDRADFWYGVGLGLAAAEDGRRASKVLLRHAPAARREAAFQGLGAGLRHGLGTEACMARLSDLQSGLDVPEANALERGMRWESYPRLQEL
jgi:hypothetical protein